MKSVNEKKKWLGITLAVMMFWAGLSVPCAAALDLKERQNTVVMPQSNPYTWQNSQETLSPTQQYDQMWEEYANGGHLNPGMSYVSEEKWHIAQEYKEQYGTQSAVEKFVLLLPPGPSSLGEGNNLPSNGSNLVPDGTVVIQEGIAQDSISIVKMGRQQGKAMPGELPLTQGMNFVCVAVNNPEFKLSDLAKLIGADLAVITFYDEKEKKFKSFTPTMPENSPFNIKITPTTGLIISMKRTPDKAIRLPGEIVSVTELKLNPGMNVVGLSMNLKKA